MDSSNGKNSPSQQSQERLSFLGAGLSSAPQNTTPVSSSTRINNINSQSVTYVKSISHGLSNLKGSHSSPLQFSHGSMESSSKILQKPMVGSSYNQLKLNSNPLFTSTINSNNIKHYNNKNQQPWLPINSGQPMQTTPKKKSRSIKRRFSEHDLDKKVSQMLDENSTPQNLLGDNDENDDVIKDIFAENKNKENNMHITGDEENEFESTLSTNNNEIGSIHLDDDTKTNSNTVVNYQIASSYEQADNEDVPFPELTILDYLATSLINKVVENQITSLDALKTDAKALMNIPSYKIAVFKSNFSANYAASYRKVKLARLIHLKYLVRNVNSNTLPAKDAEYELLKIKYLEEAYKVLLSSIVPKEWVESEDYVDILLRLRTRIMLVKLFAANDLSGAGSTLTKLDAVYAKLHIDEEKRNAFSNRAYKLKMTFKPYIDDWELGEKIWTQVDDTKDDKILLDLEDFCVKTITRLGLNGPSMLDIVVLNNGNSQSNSNQVLDNNECQTTVPLEGLLSDTNDDDSSSTKSEDLSLEVPFEDRDANTDGSFEPQIKSVSTVTENNTHTNVHIISSQTEIVVQQSELSQVNVREANYPVERSQMETQEHNIEESINNDFVADSESELSENELKLFELTMVNPSEEDLGSERPFTLIEEEETPVSGHALTTVENNNTEELRVEDRSESQIIDSKSISANDNFFKLSKEHEQNLLSLSLENADIILGQLVAEMETQIQYEEENLISDMETNETNEEENERKHHSESVQTSTQENNNSNPVQPRPKKRRKEVLFGIDPPNVSTANNHSNRHVVSSSMQEQHRRGVAGSIGLSQHNRVLSPHNSPSTYHGMRFPNTRSVRNPWTQDELEVLEEGMWKCGTNWAGILRLYGHNGTLGSQLANRTQVNLKDKARNEKSRRLKFGLELGPFVQATNYSNNSHMIL